MKVSELMHGDLVLYEYNGEKIHARVVEIYRSSALVESVSKEYEPIEIAEDKLFPIHLTTEILEKNGFEVKGKRKYFLVPNDPSLAIKREPIIGANGNSFVIGHFWEKYKDFRWFIEIAYVHEFWHALRLCGIEKEITI